MKLTREQMKIIESVLKRVYSKYKHRGLLSIYLWGTVLTDDFNLKSSDVDSIGIVSNKAKEEDSRTINDLYLKESPYKDLKLNYLYLDELNGKKIRSRLARVIHPSLLLLDFKNWKYIIGKKYSRKDFRLGEIDFDKAIQLNIIAAKTNHLPLFKKGDFKVTQYFIKNLIKVCHYLNEKEFGEHEFRYKKLLEKSPKRRKNIIKLLLKIRKSKWNEALTKKNLPILTNFINSLNK